MKFMSYHYRFISYHISHLIDEQKNFKIYKINKFDIFVIENF
jgi:hypothetical protein